MAATTRTAKQQEKKHHIIHHHVEQKFKTVPLSRTRNVRQKLSVLQCPLLDWLEDAVIHELILSPGDARLRLLEWLIVRVHPHLRSVVALTKHGETKLDKLVMALTELGLCTMDDIDLVKGTTASWRQIQFLDKLTDLVILSSVDETILSDSSSCRVREQMQQCCFFVDALCRRQDFSSICPSSISLIPPDIGLACGIDTTALADKKRQPSAGVAKLRSELDQVQSQLVDRQRQLDELKQTHSYASVNPSALSDYLKSLSVLLHTFSQLLDDFSHSYQSEIKLWTNREAPRLTALGPCMERVNSHMGILNELLEGVAQLEEIFAALLQLPRFHSDHGHQDKAHSLFQECLSLPPHESDRRL